MPDPLFVDFLGQANWLWMMFIGGTIFLVDSIGKCPPLRSQSVTVGLIAGGVIVSLWKTRETKAALPALPRPEPRHVHA